MTKLFKAFTVLSILQTDPNVDQCEINDCTLTEEIIQVSFHTKDMVSDETDKTGYWSKEGYDYDNFRGLSYETEQRLAQLNVSDSDGDIQYNECEGYENEGAVFIK